MYGTSCVEGPLKRQCYILLGRSYNCLGVTLRVAPACPGFCGYVWGFIYIGVYIYRGLQGLYTYIYI